MFGFSLGFVYVRNLTYSKIVIVKVTGESMRYHWTNVGPKPCSASEGNCPLDGGKAEHYADKIEAQQAFERKMRETEGEFNSSRKEVKLDEKVEKTVYSAYRQTLAKMKKHSDSRDTRASELKQRALKVVADRYHVRIGDVKRTVRKKDEEIGLTHEHTDNYLKELEYQKAAVALLEKHKDTKICPHCEREAVEEILVRVRVNPYRAELYEEMVPIYSCYECYRETSYDI